jgi:hypothetical protein
MSVLDDGGRLRASSTGLPKQVGEVGGRDIWRSTSWGGDLGRCRPPSRVVALADCTPSTAISCTVSADGDLTTFASAIAALGVAALFVALLGVRFSKVSVAGVSVEFDAFAAGLKEISAPMTGKSGRPEEQASTAPPSEPAGEAASDALEPISFKDVNSTELNRIRTEVYATQRGIFLAHLLGEPKSSRQAYRVAIFVVGHKRPITPETVEGATIFLGEA